MDAAYCHYHQGVDFGSNGTGNPGVPCGTPLLAAQAGTVWVSDYAGTGSASSFSGYGYMVCIDHGQGVSTLYGHMSRLDVTVNQVVTQGQQIGLSGSTGNSSGCHLHFGVLLDRWRPVDPMPYLSGVVVTPGAASGTLTYQQVIYYARAAGIPEDQLATAAAIAMVESGLRVAATHQNSATQGCPFGSTDYGLWQINTCYHPQYSATQLTSDPAYNAQAMAAISNNGADWSPWTTYTGGAYRTYLADAQAALAGFPPGAQPAGIDPTTGTTAAWGLTGQYTDAVPQDTTPQLPAGKVSITPVALGASGLVTFPHAQATCVLWIAGLEVPVIDCSVTTTTYKQPGSFNATLALETLTAYGTLFDTIVAKQPTQVIVYLGYVPDKRVRFGIDQLTAVFTGLLDAPRFSYRTRTVTLAGPDLSAIFSTPSATLSQLSDTYQNMGISDLITALVARHNPKGTATDGGLTARVGTTTLQAGQAFSQDTIKTRRQGQTEWDVLTQLTDAAGFTCYMDGTTLVAEPWPAPDSLTPLVLDWRVAGEDASAVTDLDIRFMPHSKRDYQIVTTSVQRKDGSTLQSVAGNHDSTNIITLPQPADTPQTVLDSRARSALAAYVATEVQVDATVTGVVPLAVGQPLVLRSSEIDATFANPHRRFYPSATTYDYTSGGLSMKITATNRPPGLISTSDTGSIGF